LAARGRPALCRAQGEGAASTRYTDPYARVRFEGTTEEESAPLLEFLFRHQVQPEFTCRFRWAPGSVAFWDNRSTQHNPINDYHDHSRRMLRITIAGDRPR
jgi:taurine dioxygenase